MGSSVLFMYTGVVRNDKTKHTNQESTVLKWGDQIWTTKLKMVPAKIASLKRRSGMNSETWVKGSWHLVMDRCWNIVFLKVNYEQLCKSQHSLKLLMNHCIKYWIYILVVIYLLSYSNWLSIMTLIWKYNGSFTIHLLWKHVCKIIIYSDFYGL